MTTRAAADNAGALARFVTSLATRPAHTRAAYTRDVAALCALAGDTPLARLTRAELARHLATLHGRGLSGRSLARMLSAWRAFFRHLAGVDRALADDPTAGLKPPKSARHLPSALSPDEAVQLVTIAADDTLGQRDRALFELAYSSGLRLAELAGLDIARLDLAAGEVRVLGKGAKERIVPVGAAARAALARWLESRKAIGGADADAVFVGRHGRRISPRAIELRLAQWAVAAGARPPRASAHAAALVRLARAAVLGGSARGAGNAGARVDRQHAGLHAPRFPGAGQGLRRRAPAREAPQARRLRPRAHRRRQVSLLSFARAQDVARRRQSAGVGTSSAASSASISSDAASCARRATTPYE